MVNHLRNVRELDRAANFRIYRPFVIPTKPVRGARGYLKRFDDKRLDSAWEEDETLRKVAEKRGCYAFAIKAAKGCLPWYVGMTARATFRKECFNYHNHHQFENVVEVRKGTPVIFFLASSNRGPTNRRAIREIESYLITQASTRNPKLLNDHGTSKPRWKIAGVIRGGKGNPGSVAIEFKKVMGLNGG